MTPIQIVKSLSDLTSRLGESEAEARKLLCSLLENAGIEYKLQDFNSQTPNFLNYSLTADDKPIECLPTGLKSGSVNNNYNLISSLTSSQKFIDTPNINFNPKSDAICLCNFYFAPSFAISRLDVPTIMKATSVKGLLEVEPKDYTATNILIGNLKTPKSIVFAHYDAYFSGATDNASGVAACFALILQNPSLLKDNLIIFAGNEELSYDYPVYWGKCFREFAKDFGSLLKKAEKVIVVDSVGDGKPVTETDPNLLKLAFPINDEAVLSKSLIFTGDFNALMSVYHGPEDTLGRLSNKYMDLTINALRTLLI